MGAGGSWGCSGGADLLNSRSEKDGIVRLSKSGR